MFKVKKLCVCGIAAMSLGFPVQAALAQCGTASWYHEGARTANGERYRPDGISAAHRSLPFGTRVQVRNQRTGRTVTVRINDRGPFIRGRIIDLSRGAKSVLGMGGLAPVCLTVLGRGTNVASAEEGVERAAPRRRARARYAAYGYGEVKTSARLSRRSASVRRLSRAQRAEIRALERRSRRSAERRERRMRQAAAARSRAMGL